MIRKLLLTIRKKNSQLNDLQKIFIGIGLLFLIGFGILSDMFFPFTFWFNFIRAIISLMSALLWFSFLYIFSNWRMQRKIQTDEKYVPIRKRLTYRERRNISIFLWALLFIAVLLSNQKTLLYTFINSWVFVGALAILTFVRANREEFLRDKYGVPDPKDIDFDEKVKENLKKRHDKLMKNKKDENR